MIEHGPDCEGIEMLLRRFGLRRSKDVRFITKILLHLRGLSGTATLSALGLNAVVLNPDFAWSSS